MQPAIAAPPPAPAAPTGTFAFSAGAVVGKAFSVWLANFVPFSILTLVVYLPVLVLAAFAPPGGDAGLNALDRLLSGLSGLVTTGALTYGVLESLRGGRPSVGALFGTGFRKLGSVFAVSFWVGLWILLGVLLLIVPGVMWYCALFVAVPAVVVEKKLGSTEALQRSRDLTKGSRWAIFAVCVVVVVVTFVAVFVAGLLAVVAQALPHPVPVLVATVVIALASTLGSVASAVAYHDLRLAKEGVSTAELVKVFE